MLSEIRNAGQTRLWYGNEERKEGGGEDVRGLLKARQCERSSSVLIDLLREAGERNRQGSRGSKIEEGERRERVEREGKRGLHQA